MLIAHLIGDFVLQPKSWVEKRNTQIQYLFLHIAVHAGLLLLFFINDLAGNWQNIVFLLSAHLAIDSLKIGLERNWRIKPIYLFTLDQALHFASIAAVFFFRSNGAWQQMMQQLQVDKLLVGIIALLLLVFAIPITIRLFFSKWHKESDFNNKRKTTLFNAGTIIGIMERLMILGFVLLDMNEGIGFLLAAKSIFRFGDLTNARDTKFTEYVMIGTLLSFGLGMLVAFSLKQVLALL